MQTYANIRARLQAYRRQIVSWQKAFIEDNGHSPTFMFIQGSASSCQLLSCGALSSQDIGQLVVVHRICISTPPQTESFPDLNISHSGLLISFDIFWCGYGSIPINTIFRGMNIHLPAILMFTRGTRFWHTAMSDVWILLDAGSLLGLRAHPRTGSPPDYWCSSPGASFRWPPWPGQKTEVDHTEIYDEYSY